MKNKNKNKNSSSAEITEVQSIKEASHHKGEEDEVENEDEVEEEVEELLVGGNNFQK